MSILHKTHLSCLPSLECTSPPCVAGDLEIRLSLLGKKFIFIWYAIVKKNTQVGAVYTREVREERKKNRLFFCGGDHSQFPYLFLYQQS